MLRTKISIYPITKILLILVLGTMIVIDIPIIVETSMIVLVGLLFFQDGKYLTGIKMIVIFLLFLWFEGVEIKVLGKFDGFLHSLVFMARRFLLPVMGAKYTNDSTPTGVLMSSLEKIKIPKEVIIPVAVMFRFFPTLREEYNNIKNAMKMRGISFSIKNMVKAPAACVEYILVPMLASSSKIGDELAAAAHTKGVDNPCKKIRYKESKISIWDMFIITYLIAILIMGIWSRVYDKI